MADESLDFAQDKYQGYYPEGTFKSTDPGSAFYRNPNAIAPVAPGAAPANGQGGYVFDYSSGQYQWMNPRAGENYLPTGAPKTALQPYRSRPLGDYGVPDYGTDYNASPDKALVPSNYVDLTALENLYGHPAFQQGWYKPSAEYLARSPNPYTGQPQTVEEAAAISEYFTQYGELPQSEWVQRYMAQKYPNQGQPGSYMTPFAGATPAAGGTPERFGFNPNTSVPRSASPDLMKPEGIAMPDLTATYKSRFADYLKSWITAAPDKTDEEKKQDAAFRAKGLEVTPSPRDKRKREANVILDQVQDLLSKGASLSSLPHYADINKMWGENVPVYGDKGELRGHQWYGILEPELYSTKRLNQATNQAYADTPYGANQPPRNYNPPSPVDYTKLNNEKPYQDYVNEMSRDPDVKKWLESQYSNFYRDWIGAGAREPLNSFVGKQLDEALKEYKPQRQTYTQRYAPSARLK